MSVLKEAEFMVKRREGKSLCDVGGENKVIG
jgi:hypothetical protein